jgi:hypothetical protein
MSQLPLSQQSLNMAFHVLDKDRDGLISAAEAYKMVAFYLVSTSQLQESSRGSTYTVWHMLLRTIRYVVIHWFQPQVVAGISTCPKQFLGPMYVGWVTCTSAHVHLLTSGASRPQPICSSSSATPQLGPAPAGQHQQCTQAGGQALGSNGRGC